MYLYSKYRKRALRYFQNHVEYNAFIHVVGGAGLGVLLASPLAFPHPVRWAVALLGISLLGHLYAVTAKK